MMISSPRRTEQLVCDLLCQTAVAALFLVAATTAQSSQGCKEGFGQIDGPNPFDDPTSKHFILPSMGFACNGNITEIQFRGRFQNNGNNSIVFETWRSIADEQYSVVTSATYVGRNVGNGAVSTSVVVDMMVSSGDRLGFFLPRSEDLSILASSTEDFTVFQLKGGSETSYPTVDVGDLYDSSSSYSPLISVSFVPQTSAVLAASDAIASSKHVTDVVVPSITPSTPCNPGDDLVAGPDNESASAFGFDSCSTMTVANTTTPENDSVGGIVVGVAVAVVSLLVIVVLVAVMACVRYRLNRKDHYSLLARFNPTTPEGHIDLHYIMRGRRRWPLTRTTVGSLKNEYDFIGNCCESLVIPSPSARTEADLGGATSRPTPGQDGYEVVVRQEDPVSGVVLTAAGQAVLYDTAVDRSEQGGHCQDSSIYEQVGSIYEYVPGEKERSAANTPRRMTDIKDELRKICNNEVAIENEDKPFVPPGERLDTLYNQLSEKKCIEIPRHCLLIDKLLGNGEFGDVYKAVWETPYGPQDVAMKMLKKGSSEKDKISFLKEAALMGQFRHPHIIRLLGTVTLEEPCIIVLEFLPKKDLESYLQAHQPEPGVLPESSLPSQLLKFCRQIADGMKYLSSKGFIHRDLATRNVLLDKNLKCKIADFGLSKTLRVDSDCYVVKGGKVPVRWTAPESLFYKKYTTESDVWSFGMVMFEIWSLGEKPFAKYEVMELVEKLKLDPFYIQPPPPGCPKEVFRLMVKCWNPDHHSRPSFTSVLGVLNGSSESLLVVPVEDLECTNDLQKAAQLGMPLECADQLYSDLQQQYAH